MFPCNDLVAEELLLQAIGWEDAGDFDAERRAALPGCPDQAVVFIHLPGLLQQHVLQIGRGFPMHSGKITDKRSEADVFENLLRVKVEGI